MANWTEKACKAIEPFANVGAQLITENSDKIMAVGGAILAEAAPVLIPVAAIGAAGCVGYWVGKKIGDLFF